MAELNTGRRLQPRIDLTAMVDLAFLLITFFMLTTSLNKERIRDVVMPGKENVAKDSGFADNRTMTILLGEHNQIVWYWGLLDAPITEPAQTRFGSDGIRSILLEMKETVQKITGDPGKGLMVLIHPSEVSSYENLINILDEMDIAEINQYFVGNITSEEEELLTMAKQSAHDNTGKGTIDQH